MDDGILITSGYEKPHHRVLKPPGGETHDIFGQHYASADIAAAGQHGRNRSHQSHIFDNGGDRHSFDNGGDRSEMGSGGTASSTIGATSPVPASEILAAGGGGGAGGGGVGRRPANGNINGNNVNRIFGNDDQMDGNLPQRKVKDYHKSNIFGIGDDVEAINGNANTPHRRPNINNHEMMSAVGTAYTPSKRRQFEQQVQQAYGNPITGEGYANGSPKIDNGSAGSRGRNPPGGHSTNLW